MTGPSRTATEPAMASRPKPPEIPQFPAKATDPRACVLVLLAGEAGVRLGEMVALEWRDIDFAKRQLCVQRSPRKDQVASPKGGRLWYVPLTARLAAALHEQSTFTGPRVLYQDDGAPLSAAVVQQQTLSTAKPVDMWA